jgi:hypothetical protein
MVHLNHEAPARVVQGMRPTTRQWLAGAMGAAALAAALGGCGSDDDTADDAANAGTGAAAALVSTQEVDGLGTVLVDESGRALYFADQETDGTI